MRGVSGSTFDEILLRPLLPCPPISASNFIIIPITIITITIIIIILIIIVTIIDITIIASVLLPLSLLLAERLAEYCWKPHQYLLAQQ